MKIKIFLLFLVMIFFNFAGVEAGHVNCGQTIYSDTVLDSDLICTGDGLTIDGRFFF